MFAGALLLVLVAVAGHLAELIPLTTLAAILIVIGFETLVREVRHLVEARWVSKPHLVAAGVTVVVGVYADLTAAIFTGVVLSLLLFTLTMADRAKLVQWQRVAPDRWREIDAPPRLESGSTTVLALTGSAYFATTYRAPQAIPKYTDAAGAALVLQVRGFRFYSLTGLDYLKELVIDLQAHGHLIVFADVEPDQRTMLERTGMLAMVGEQNVVWRRDVIGEAATEAVAVAQAWHATNLARGDELD